MTQNKPIIQVRNTSPFGDRTDNVTLEGNQLTPLQTYMRLWESVLVPRGGVSGIVLESLLYVHTVAFCVMVGGWLVVGLLVSLACYLLGGLTATVLDKRLTAPFVLRCVTLAIGLVVTML